MAGPQQVSWSEGETEGERKHDPITIEDRRLGKGREGKWFPRQQQKKRLVNQGDACLGNSLWKNPIIGQVWKGGKNSSYERGTRFEVDRRGGLSIGGRGDLVGRRKSKKRVNENGPNEAWGKARGASGKRAGD